MKIGVQLYTLRSSFEKDLWGTFDALAGQGYKNVELAGTYGLSNQELAKGLKDRGLTAISAHVGMDQFDNDLPGLIEFAKAFEIRDLIVPWIQADQHGGWDGVGKKLTRYAGELEGHGLRVGYHNHDFEFAKVGDDLAFDVLWQHADPKKVIAELDLYWVVKGGQDPVAWLEQLSGRVPFTHFKDMKKDAEFFTEVGSGRIDWPALVGAGEKAGVKWAIVEHDQPEIDPLESVKKSREYLLSIGLED